MSESWIKDWEKCEKYFDMIKQELKKIKEVREAEFSAKEHRTVINKVLGIFEVL